MELPLFSDGDPKKRHRFDLRLDYCKKDAHLIILYRLELDLISDQDPKSMDARLTIFIRCELGLVLIMQFLGILDAHLRKFIRFEYLNWNKKHFIFVTD